MSLVSIIIPTYNRISLLKQAVISCIQQTHSKVEIIIVDDGSTDGTELQINELMLGEWSGKDIKFVKQKNSGASAARNKGIELAKGKYIQFLDSDDLLFKDKLKSQIESFESNQEINPEACSCYGLMGYLDHMEEALRIGIKCNTAREYIHFLCGRIVHGMCTPAPLWESSFLKSQQGWRTDINFGDDLEYYIRLLSKVNHILFVEKELFLARQHEGERLSTINQESDKIASAILTKKTIYETITKNNLWNLEMQTSFLSSLKTTYSNVLVYSNKKQILDFEKWLQYLSSKPKYRLLFPLLIITRKSLGKRNLLGFHQLIMKIRK